MIEFSFKGEVSDLIAALQALQGNAGGFRPSESKVPPIMPQPVTAQQPPPPAPRLHPPTMEPLHHDPVYGGVGGPSGPSPQNLMESNPVPSEYPPQTPEVKEGFDFGQVPLVSEAWHAFEALTLAWLQGFDSPRDEEGNSTEEQPDRLQLLKDVGSGRWALHIMRWCGHYGSLQGAVYAALTDNLPDLGLPEDIDLIDLADRLSANIVQVAHAAFPDIVGFHDHSTKWKRNLQESAS